jgi:hypothetical protein
MTANVEHIFSSEPTTREELTVLLEQEAQNRATIAITGTVRLFFDIASVLLRLPNRILSTSVTRSTL